MNRSAVKSGCGLTRATGWGAAEDGGEVAPRHLSISLDRLGGCTLLLGWRKDLDLYNFKLVQAVTTSLDDDVQARLQIGGGGRLSIPGHGRQTC